MLRVLHSVSNMARAGIETMLMNYYREIDRSQIQFDFLANKPVPGEYDEEIRSMGGRVFVSPGLNPLHYPTSWPTSRSPGNMMRRSAAWAGGFS